MNQVRIQGDPFGDSGPATVLRCFLRQCLGNGLDCALSLTAVAATPPRPGDREIPLTDGVRDLRIGTRLPAAEVDLLLRAAGVAVSATAPVVVFAPAGELHDAVVMAGLEWPRACAVIGARDGQTPTDLLEKVKAELRWAGAEAPPHTVAERDLAPWATLPPASAQGPLVHVGRTPADGTDLVIAAWREHFAPHGHGLRLVVGNDASEGELATLCELLRDAGPTAEIVRAPFEPGQVRDAAAIVLPWREPRDGRVLVLALASGRPVAVSRWAATAPLVGRPGVCQPIGGRLVPAEANAPTHFAPHPRALVAAVKAAIGDAATGRRARQHVHEELTAGRPPAPPVPLVDPRLARPTVVLEAPFFETSSSSELSIETARALQRRGRVDLKLVPTVPMHVSLAALRARAPELEPLLCRTPGAPDLWLSSGWPVRTSRPECRTFAVRVDQEYGALPLELTPMVSQEADLVVVHSEYVHRIVTAAGRPMEQVKVVPHGVDAPMHEHAKPDPRVIDWKGELPAVLFCGGLIWRKGFDVFLRAALEAKGRGAKFCLVVKTVGHSTHYGRFHLQELVERFQNTPGTPRLLLVERDLSRAELASLYTACDLLVHPYRGEGFCLPVLEARACGLPVLATAGGGADPLLAGPGAVKIPAARRAVELPQPHVSLPWVMEPSAEDAGRLLAEALADLPARQVAAKGFARSVRAAYPWDAAAELVEQTALAAMAKRRVGNSVPAAVVEPVVTLPTAPAKPAAEPELVSR